MLMNKHDDAYVDAMLMVNMQANTRSVTLMVADGYERWLADGYGERYRGCRSTHGGVPIGCGG